MRRSLVVLVVMTVFLALVGLPGATAEKNPGPKNPEWIVNEIHDAFGPFPIFSCTDGVPGAPFAPFSDFNVVVSGEFHLVHSHQPVGNRDVVKHQTWVWGVDTFTNSEDDSKFATGRFNASDVGQLSGPEDFETGTIRAHGRHWNVVAPGYGQVIREAGIFTIVLEDGVLVSETFKGVNDLLPFTPEADERLCAALS